MFAVIAITIWALGHAYLGWSLGRFSARKRPRRIIWALLALHFMVTLIAMTVGRVTQEASLIKDALQWLGFVGMGLFTLLFAACMTRDLVYGVMKLGQKLIGGRTADSNAQPGGAAHVADTDGHLDTPAATESAHAQRQAPVDGSADAPADHSRRELFHNVLNLSLVGASASATGYGYFQATRIPEVRRVDVPVKGLAEGLDGFRIVQLSDIHVGPTIKRAFAEGVAARANQLKPDLIAVTGDLVDGHVRQLRYDVAPLGELRAKFGTFYVTGNHEYYWDGPGWCAEMARLGWRVLINTHEVLSVNGARLLVGGVTDYSAGRMVEGHTTDPHKAIAGAGDVDFRLLLAHQPKSVWEAAKAGFDLQLSGHTHGGQFWPWSLLVGMAHPFSRGLHDYENMQIYVSCGTGYWGPPLRLAAPSEITLLTLRRV